MNSERSALNFLTTGRREVEDSPPARICRDTLLKAIQELEALRAASATIYGLESIQVVSAGLYGHLPRCSSCGAYDGGPHANQCTNARKMESWTVVPVLQLRTAPGFAYERIATCGICDNTYEACDCARTGRR